MNALTVKNLISLKNILLATDFSPISLRALPYAVDLAVRFGSMIHVAHVIRTEDFTFARPETLDAFFEEAREASEQRMQALLQPVRNQGIPSRILYGHGNICDVLVEFVEESEIDLITVGSAGRTGIQEWALSSVTRRIIREMPCPVLAVGPFIPEGGAVRIERILLATDFSPASGQAVRFALALAREYQAHLMLLNVVEKMAGESLKLTVELARRRLHLLVPPEADLPSIPEVITESGPAVDHILKIATERSADLLILGVRGEGAFSRTFKLALGSTAYKVTSGSPCPVLTVPE
jgi:nucleotide-binding universal stress UspA family protein